VNRVCFPADDPVDKITANPVPRLREIVMRGMNLQGVPSGTGKRLFFVGQISRFLLQ
jgi:hypothetical protein